MLTTQELKDFVAEINKPDAGIRDFACVISVLLVEVCERLDRLHDAIPVEPFDCEVRP